MIKKKVSPIIARDDASQKGKIVGMNIEYRLFGLVIYSKVLYTPDRYNKVSWRNNPEDRFLVEVILNQ
ncbi:hypothetical protein [Dysgonomonas sp.]